MLMKPNFVWVYFSKLICYADSPASVRDIAAFQQKGAFPDLNSFLVCLFSLNL